MPLDLPPSNSIQQAIPELSQGAARRAQSALQCARAAGQKFNKFLIFDASRSSSERRLFVLDVSDKPQLLFSDWVAHGAGSDANKDGRAERFSNKPNSNATSLGLYRISERYVGKHGWSYRLDGLTPGFNDNARQRAVVLHSAAYVMPGHVGRSWGCPAVRPETLKRLDRLDVTGSLLWVDGEDLAFDLPVPVCEALK